jgi:hypothetical protein
MSLVLVVALGIGLLLVLLFFAVNRWSSRAQDREKSAGLRSNRQMTEPDKESRGTGIN